jgi:hypothetical protein
LNHFVIETKSFDDAIDFFALVSRQTGGHTRHANCAWSKFRVRDVRDIAAVDAAGVSDDYRPELAKELSQSFFLDFMHWVPGMVAYASIATQPAS